MARRGGLPPGVERRIVGEDRVLQRPQLRPRVETEFVDEDSARILEGPEGVGLAAGAVQGEHQEPVEPFTQRMVRAQRRQLGDQFCMFAELQVGVDPVLQCAEAEFLQSNRFSLQHPLVADAVQRGPVPQRKSGRQDRRRGDQIAGREVLMALPDRNFEAPGVEFVVADVETVAVRLGHQPPA